MPIKALQAFFNNWHVKWDTDAYNENGSYLQRLTEGNCRGVFIIPEINKKRVELGISPYSHLKIFS